MHAHTPQFKTHAPPLDNRNQMMRFFMSSSTGLIVGERVKVQSDVIACWICTEHEI